jgi:hypothetical protein
MAELAAVSLASSIVTFLNVSVRVATCLSEYHATGNAAPSVFRQISTQLPLINDILQSMKQECEAIVAGCSGSGSGTSPADSSNVDAAKAARLGAVVTSCHKSIERLKALLDKVLVLPSDSHSQRTCKAFSSVWREQNFRKVKRQLDKALQVLDLSFSKQVATSVLAASVAAATAAVAATGTSRTADKHDSQTESLYDVPLLCVAHMVRHLLLLATLERHLDSSSDCDTSTPGVPELTVVVLLGLGGQDMTQLALDYCRTTRASRRFDVIVWLNASNLDTAVHGFEQLSTMIAPSRTFDCAAAKVAYVKDWLAHLPNPWLMVFDNYDQPGDFPAIASFFPSSAAGAILVMSRHGTSDRLGHVVSITGMSDDEALELLLRQAKTKRNDGTVKAGHKIMRRLGHLPLAIDQAGAYIGVQKLLLDRFLQQFHERREAVLKHTPSLWEYRQPLGAGTNKTPLSVFTTWELSFRQLRRSVADRDSLRRFLAVAAHYDITRISEDVFAASCGSTHALPQWMYLFTSDGKWDHEKFEAAVVEFADLSLLQIVDAARDLI